MMTVEVSDIFEAMSCIYPHIKKTPILSSSLLNEKFNTQIFFKCENFQKTGAFKYRGAYNAIVQYKKKEKLKFSLIAHSSGNHAQAIALASKAHKLKSTLIIPKNASKVKIEAISNYGSKIIFCNNTLEDREKTLLENKQKKDILIHPFNDPYVIAGQGTAALELIKDIPDLDALIIPIGGGGLISGSSVVLKYIKKNIKVFGVEPLLANEAYRSKQSGILQKNKNTQSIADGLLGSISEITFSIINQYVDDIFTVKEENIKKSMRLIFERMKVIVEPSAATTLAAIIENKNLLQEKKIGVILSGGNIDFKDFF